MPHTPSHIDNSGGGNSSHGRIPLVGVLTPFKEYSHEIFAKGTKGNSMKQYLSTNEAIPFINTTGIDICEGDHIGFRIMILGTKRAQFVFAIDLIKIDDDTEVELWDDLVNELVIVERLEWIRQIKSSYKKVDDDKWSKFMSQLIGGPLNGKAKKPTKENQRNTRIRDQVRAKAAKALHDIMVTD